MRDNSRFAATLVIWIGFTIITSTIGTSAVGPFAHDSSVAVFGVILVLALTAMISTLAVWLGRSDSGQEESSRVAKAKRQSRDRIERLVESLDDDDVYELEALLLAREEKTERQSGS
jgi:uncharacterized membrane protein YhiD involved in acid resistance